VWLLGEVSPPPWLPQTNPFKTPGQETNPFFVVIPNVLQQLKKQIRSRTLQLKERHINQLAQIEELEEGKSDMLSRENEGKAKQSNGES